MIELKMPASAPKLAFLDKIISIFFPYLSMEHLNQNILWKSKCRLIGYVSNCVNQNLSHMAPKVCIFEEHMTDLNTKCCNSMNSTSGNISFCILEVPVLKIKFICNIPLLSKVSPDTFFFCGSWTLEVIQTGVLYCHMLQSIHWIRDLASCCNKEAPKCIIIQT